MIPSIVQLYYTQCLNLAKTMCIKSEDSAQALNNYIIATYGASSVDLNDPTTWKYYLNICGQYHFSDTLMQVTSLDTLDVIDFTVDNLANNPATAQAYQYGTRYYYSLLSQYPNQETLILGILYPANMQQAVSATNGTILSYPPQYVEDQEINFIPKLQEWIYNYQVRWNVKAFTLSDSLYQVSYWSVFYLNLYLKILNIRLSNCKTPYANSFHYTQYLASHQGLDRFIPYLTLEQIFFLYRNILYIERHPGWTSTFQTLINELLTKRNISISEYYIKLQTLFNQYKSVLSFDRKPINPIIDEINKYHFNYNEFLIKTQNLAPGNLNYLTANETSIETFIQNSRFDEMLTKDLESLMFDYTDAVPHPLSQIFLNEWLYLSAKGYYIAYVNFTDPTTLTQYTLSALDAFIYMAYLYIKKTGLSVTTIPVFYATKVLKPQAPSVSQMTSLWDSGFTDASKIAQYWLSLRPSSMMCSSILSFNQLCEKIYNLGLQEWYIIGNNGNLNHRGPLWNMADFNYIDTPISTPYTGENIQQWINQRDLPDYNPTDANFDEYILNIYKAGTGTTNGNLITITQIQSAMIEILKLLSSYSIQLMTYINKAPITVLNWAAIRAAPPNTQGYAEFFVEEDVDVVDYHFSIKHRLNFMADQSISGLAVRDVTQNKYNYNLDSTIVLSAEYEESYPVYNSPFIISCNNQTNCYNNLSDLTNDQINTIPDIYQNNIR